MGAGVRPLPPTPDDHEFQAWKAAQSPTHDDAEFRAWQAQQKQARMTSTGDEAHGGVIPSALDAMTFGLSRKAIAAGQALASEGLTGHVADAYKQNVHAQEAAAQQYHEAHNWVDDAAQLVGGAAGVAATGGLSGAAEGAAQAGRLAKYGKAIGTGIQYGTANALGHSDALMDGRGMAGVAGDAAKGAGVGALAGAVSIPLSAGVSKVIGATPLPRVVQGIARRVGANNVADALGPEGEARVVIAKNAAMDAAAAPPTPAPSRFTSPLNKNLPKPLMDGPLPAVERTPSRFTDDFNNAGGEPVTGMEIPRVGVRPLPAPVEQILAHKPAPMALQQAGTNVEGLGEAIAQRPGPGKAIIQAALTDRAKVMRPSITGALEAGSGVDADAGMQPLQDAIDARGAEAKQLYGKFREVAKGETASSPTLDQIKATPAGKVAFNVARTQQGNFFREPVEGEGVPPGYDPAQWAELKQTMQERGMSLPAVPTNMADNPETVLLAYQHLAKLAKLGTDDGQSGQLSASAKGALSVWGKVREELHPLARAANDAFAARSRVIEMMRKGQNIYRTPENPTASTPGGAIAKSLDGLDAKLATAAPAEQQGLQEGAGMAAHARFNARPNVKSPGRVFPAEGQVARQTSYAFPTDEHAQAFQDVVGSWDKLQQQTERMTGNSRTNLRKNLDGDGALVPLKQLTSGRVKGMIRSVVGKLDTEYQAGKRQVVDTEIAKILTSPDGQALVKAAAAGNLRARTALSLRLAAAGSLGGATGARAPQ